MIPGIDPKVDYIFRMLFGNQANIDLLASLLNAVLQPSAEHQFVSLELLNPFNDKESPEDKLSILDIKARDRSGHQYNVEMEMAGPWTYPRRVLYYWAVLHTEQLHEGEAYDQLRPTISISFVNKVLVREVSDYHLCFELRAVAHHEVVFSDQLAIHTLELPKFKKAIEEISTPLDAWCYFLKHGENLDADQLPPILSAAGVNRAMEVLKMVSQTDLERERYKARVKAERDRMMYEDDALRRGMQAGLQEGRQQGLQQGLEQGIQQGREQGLEKGDLLGRIYLCQRLLKRALTPREELLALPDAELRAKAADLEAEVERLQTGSN